MSFDIAFENSKQKKQDTIIEQYKFIYTQITLCMRMYSIPFKVSCFGWNANGEEERGTISHESFKFILVPNNVS